MMKRFILFLFAVLTAVQVFSQNDFEKYRQQQQAKFEQHKQQNQQKFDALRDSLNREYASFLEKTWKKFDLQRQERGFKPMPKPPVVVPDAPKPPQPEPEKVPVVVKPEPPKPQPQDEKPPVVVPPPAPDVPKLKTDFFGTEISVAKMQMSVPHLSGIDEKAVANYWTALAKLNTENLTNEILRLKNDLSLNDWAMYLLINKLFDAHFSNGTENEKIVFSTFMLNQLGYRAKIGKTSNELVQLLAFNNALFNTLFFSYGKESGVRYAVVNLKRKNLFSVQTCAVEYEGANKNIEMSVLAEPKFTRSNSVKTLNFNDIGYNLQANKNLIDFYETFPCTDFSVYASAPLDKAFLQSAKAEILPKISGKSQEEQVNFLLHFVQFAFRYKTDDEQYGYEKWNFAEETLVSNYSDCDDRAIFFAQLVKNLLGMKVVLIHYPQYHLATAVKFDNQQINGTYITLDNSKYLICDPTYIGADIGMAMPQLQNIPIEVVKLK